MSRATLILDKPEARAKAAGWVRKAPFGTRLTFQASKRSLPQNDHMWALLTDIAQQIPWHGVKLTADDWKLIFLDALRSELRIVPNLSGDGFVNLGRSSSDLSKGEMAELIELIRAWASQHGVRFHWEEAA